MKKANLKSAHTSNSKKGMGDNYGTGSKNPMGSMRESYTPGMVPVSKKKLKVPPKSVV